MLYTLNQAANVTGKSPSVIYKALKKGQISYVSKEGNRYQIEASELFRVFPKKGENKKEYPENILEKEKEYSQEYPNEVQQRLTEALIKLSEVTARYELANQRAEEWKNLAEQRQRELEKWQTQTLALLQNPSQKKGWSFFRRKQAV